jgi:hypothetical protein
MSRISMDMDFREPQEEVKRFYEGVEQLRHKNMQNTTKYAQLTNPRRDEEARKLFADHRVV